MTKDTKDTFEFLKPRDFVKAYPNRAKVLGDGVLSKYVSWVLVDRSSVAAGKTYLLMTSSAYKKASYRFAPMTADFERNARHKMAAPLREQYAIVEKHEATIAALYDELEEYRDHRVVFDENQLLVSQEIAAVQMLKRELLGLIEHLKIGNSDANSSLRGFFARIDEFAFNVFAKEAWKVTNRRAK
jgi:hypothetical protein